MLQGGPRTVFFYYRLPLKYDIFYESAKLRKIQDLPKKIEKSRQYLLKRQAGSIFALICEF